MKSVLQAGWLLTVAVGNIIVLIVAEAAKLPDQVGGFYYISRHILSSLTLKWMNAWNWMKLLFIEHRYVDKVEKYRGAHKNF